MPKGSNVVPTIAAAFRAHQATILDLLHQARALFADGRIPSRPQQRASRAAIGDALDDYQAFKHHNVYDPVIAGGSSDAPTAAALKDDCIALSQEYAAYADRPDDDPAASRSATLEMATNVTLAMIREFELVQQMAVYRLLADRPVERDHGGGG